MILPTNGTPFGPGGNGMKFFRRLSHAHASMAGMRIKSVPTVGLKAMMRVKKWLVSSTLRVSNIMLRYETLCRGGIGVANTTQGQWYVANSPSRSAS